ncbi:FG-GAP repeat domain-containing protein [Actinoplanes sp. URMC 104]|uniref:FG-GAP repeat domain-containing protein n=1 Tax=Actinoplanes sp. URMC 104 TaxID=3423409 RepID=UPI003F1D5760
MRRALAASVGGAVVAAGLSLPGVAQAATAPTEIKVVPAPTVPATYVTDTPIFAGATGFLHRRTTTSGLLWTTYADRRTTAVDELNNVPNAAISPAGGDTVLVFASVPGRPSPTGTRPSLNLSTRAWRDVPATGTIAYSRQMGDTVVAIDPAATPDTVELRRVAADGSWIAAPVTGVPDGTTTMSVVANDGDGAVLRFDNADGTRYGLLDAASGEVDLLPAVPVAGRVVLTDDRIGLLTTTVVRSFIRTAVAAGTPGEPDVVTLPVAVPVTNQGLAGDDVIAPQPGSGTQPVMERHTGSGEPAVVVPRALAATLQAPDGVLFVGGTSTGDWSMRKATATGESALLPLYGPTVNAGVTLSQGVLRHVAARAVPGEGVYRLFAEQIGPGAPGTGSPVADADLVSPVPCETDAFCVRMADGSLLGSSYISRGSTGYSMRSSDPTGYAVPVGAGAKVIDASPNFRVVNTATTQQVLRNGTVNQFPADPVAPAALWFDFLWRAEQNGVKDYNLGPADSGNPPIAIGCPATEVQVVGNRLYWTCGAQGTAGILDLKARRNVITLPAGQFLLGDNYLVRHDASGALLRYDITGNTLGEPVTMATFPRGDLADDRNITWAVDKFGGDVAWVDAQNAVHIVDPGVAPSAPVAELSSATPANLTLPGTLTVTAQLSRPVTATALIITQVRTGRTVRVTGGAARVAATVTWDGAFGDDRAAKGPYRWTLTATADGTESTVATGTSTFTVGCGGKPLLHSYECTSQPSLLALNQTTGQGAWQFTRRVTGDTIGLTSGGSESLGTLTGLVPFGDISKDYKNDLLVRRSDGSLRVYLGGEQPPFGSNTSLLIPGNWNAYDALVHTGDLTGDGQSDLVVRERASGSLYYFAGNGKGGFGTPVKIEGGYKGYSKVVGPGDINGDGKADLMLQYDPTSTMYALYGNGNGTFQAGLKVVGTGWLGYNSVIGIGDLNEDGRNDLLMRDTAGVLYRKLGTGTGTFGDRAQIGTGYQQYTGIY